MCVIFFESWARDGVYAEEHSRGLALLWKGLAFPDAVKTVFHLQFSAGCVCGSLKEFFILETYGARNTLVCGEEKENRVCAEMVYFRRFMKICLKAHLKLLNCQPWAVIYVGWVLISTLWDFSLGLSWFSVLQYECFKKKNMILWFLAFEFLIKT